MLLSKRSNHLTKLDQLPRKYHSYDFELDQEQIEILPPLKHYFS